MFSKRAIKRCEFVILCLFFASLCGPLLQFSVLAGTNFSITVADVIFRLVGICATVFFLFNRGACLNQVDKKSIGLMFIFIIAAMASATLANNVTQALKGVAALTFSLITSLYIIGRFKKREVYHALFWAIAIFVIVNFIELIFNPESAYTINKSHLSWLKGIYSDKNQMGWYAYFACLLLLIKIYFDQDRIYRGAGLFILSLYLLFAAGSKSAVICLAFTLSSHVILNKKYNRKFFSYFYLVMISVGLIFFTFRHATELKPENIVSISGRFPLWHSLWAYVYDRPFLGYGLNNFWPAHQFDLFVKQGWPMNHAHNGFLELLLDVGWMGFIPLITMFVWRVADYWKVFRRAEKNDLYHKMPFYFLMSFVVFNLTETPIASFFELTWHLFLWYCLTRARGFESKPNPVCQI